MSEGGEEEWKTVPKRTAQPGHGTVRKINEQLGALFPKLAKEKQTRNKESRFCSALIKKRLPIILLTMLNFGSLAYPVVEGASAHRLPW